MIDQLETLVSKYDMRLKGVIQAGAHFGQELDIYWRIGLKNILLFEPLPAAFAILTRRANGRATLVNKALGSRASDAAMYVETCNEGQSSSLLRPTQHLTEYPNIQFSETVTVPVVCLDTVVDSPSSYNLLCLDTQGYELEALQGATRTLQVIAYIITEVSRAPLYENGALVAEIDKFLADYDFDRVETQWAHSTWGNALYIKRHHLKITTSA